MGVIKTKQLQMQNTNLFFPPLMICLLDSPQGLYIYSDDCVDPAVSPTSSSRIKELLSLTYIGGISSVKFFPYHFAGDKQKNEVKGIF